MFLTRVLLLLLAFWAVRRLVQWFTKGSASRVSSQQSGPVGGRKTPTPEVLSEQKIEEADFEELPEDRSKRSP